MRKSGQQVAWCAERSAQGQPGASAGTIPRRVRVYLRSLVLVPQADHLADHARLVTLRNGQALLALLVAGALLGWPTDYLFFADRPEVIESYRTWRITVTLIGLLGVALAPLLRRRLLAWTYPVVAAFGMFLAGVLGFGLAGADGLEDEWFRFGYLVVMGILPLPMPPMPRVLVTTGVAAAFSLAYLGRDLAIIGHSSAPGVLLNLVFTAVVSILMGHIHYRQVAEGYAQNVLLAKDAAELDALHAVKNEFLANISHELRTPLTLILAALRQQKTAPSPEAVESGLRNGARLLLLIDELLELALFVGGAGRYEPRQVDVARLVHQLCANFQPRTAGEGELEVQGTGEPLWATVDPRLLTTALYNLLSNAYKFSDPEGRRLRCRVAGDPHRVVIEVEDNGPGIPPEDRARVFERFVQIDGSSTRRQDGTGIGLALVQKIATAHGGRVELESEEGSGCLLRLVLPRRDTSPAGGDGSGEIPGELTELHRAAWSRTSGPADGAPGASPANASRVLLVEDNAELRAYTARLLRQHYVVTEAADGEEALAAFARVRPDLAVVDLMLPRVDGLEIARTIGRGGAEQRVPVLVLTGRADSRARAEAYAAGVDDYLTKPFDEVELCARVANLLRLRAKERELANVNRQLEEIVAARTAELRRLAAHLQSSSEEERRRLARELHDEAGQILTAIQFEIELARDEHQDVGAPQGALDHISDMVQQVSATHRRIITSLRPEVLDQHGLGSAIRWYVGDFAGRTLLDVDLRVEPPDMEIGAELSVAAFRILQEALTNVMRHARATRARVIATLGPATLTLEIGDDGAGFDPGAVQSGRYGLIGMRERAEILGGELIVQSAPGAGAQVTLVLPLERDPDAPTGIPTAPGP